MAARLADGTVGIGDGIDLHYVEAGEGRPLIIIPSWSLTGAAYRRQLEALSRTRRVMAFDMRGHGESSTPAGGYRVSRLAADLRAVIERLALDEIDLMGHSIGSSIIWSYIDLYGRGPPRAADLRGPGAVGDGEARLVGGRSRRLWLPAAGPRGPSPSSTSRCWRRRAPRRPCR